MAVARWRAPFDLGFFLNASEGVNRMLWTTSLSRSVVTNIIKSLSCMRCLGRIGLCNTSLALTPADAKNYFQYMLKVIGFDSNAHGMENQDYSIYQR